MQDRQDALDLLDKGSEGGFFEDLEGFIQKWEKNNKLEIQELEQNVENERQKLDAMEKSFVGAKYKSQADDTELRLVKVTKQSRALNGMMNVFKNMTSREIDAKQEWDSQWREKFAEIRQQHTEMKRSLKRKHGIELKMMKDSFRDDVRSLGLKFQSSNGIPSPHAVRRVQDQSMRKVVVLYHKHAEERMLLLSKIMNQEELMIRAKSRSLQDKMKQTHSISKKLYVSLKSSSSNLVDADEGEYAMMERQRSHQGSNPEPIQVDDVDSRGEISMRGSAIVLPMLETSFLSPKYHTSTFVTELSEDASIWEAKKSKPVRNPVFQHRRADSEQINSRSNAYTRMEDTGSAFVYIQRDSTSEISNNENQTKGFPHAVDSLGSMPMQLQGGARFPGQEFAPWSQPSPQTILKAQGKPVWISHPCRWNPNIIALENSLISSAKTEQSPYAMLSADGQSASRATLRRRTARPFRVSGSARAVDGRSSCTGPGRQKSVAATISLSSLPGLRKERANSSRSKAALPEIGQSDPDRHRQYSTDQKFNRPKEQSGSGDEFPKATQKYDKLDSWIEEKILQVLGGGSSKSAILAQNRGDPGTRRAELDQGAEDEHDQVRAEQDEHHDDQVRAEQFAPTPGQHGSGDTTGHGTPTDTWGPLSSRSGHTGSTTTSSLTKGGDVGGFLARLRSEMADAAEEDSPANPGLRVQVNTGSRSTASLTSAQINDLLNPVKGKQTKEVPQDEEGSVEFIGSSEEHEDIAERRAHFDRARGTVLIQQSQQGSATPKTPKRVGWNLSPRESEAENMSDIGTDVLRLSTAGGYDSSRPLTHSSSRPDTSHSVESFIGEGGDDEEGSGDQGGLETQQSKTFTDTVVTEFFSKVRHNKVAECEELVNVGFPMDARDRHGNTPLLVAAQNGHKRLVKLFLRAGANSNSTNHQGNTALHFTMSYGYQSLANYILSKGADDTLMNMKGLTCYDGLG